MIASVTRITSAAVVCIAFIAIAACGEASKTDTSGEHGAASEEFERGPHRGRMLRSGTFAAEMTIFETDVPPEFHVYVYDGDKPLNPGDVALTVALKRLGGRTDNFTFKPQQDYLVSSGAVREPHSFDVVVTATHGGKRHQWTYASYEGRTTISDKAATEAGVTTDRAGPAKIKTTVELLGALELAPGAKADLRARFPGRVLSVAKNIGDKVRAGEELARVESNESLQSYAIVSPTDGVIIDRSINQGDITSDGIIFAVGNPARLVAEFHVFDRDATTVKAGQAVRITALDGKSSIDTVITSITPFKNPGTQTVMARAAIDNASGALLPGMQVKGAVVVEEVDVPLAVKTDAIQPFRDFEVVYAKVGETYEVRMLEVGRRSMEWTEVLGGVDSGEVYVSSNSFLIKADIEKSGASHDH